MNIAKLKTNDGTFHGRKIDALADALRAVNVQPGRGYKVRQTPLGLILDIEPGNSGGGVCPFDISVAAGDTGTIDVTVRPGTVNSLLATNYADTFNVSDSGLKFVKLTVVSDGAEITSVSLSVDSDDPVPPPPTPFALPPSAEFAIGVIVDDVPYKLIGCGSIQLLGHETFKTDKDPPAEPGELPYVPHYVWRMEII